MSKWNKMEVKLESVQEYVNGLGVLELCEKYKICKTTMYNWVSQYKEIVHYPNVGYRIKRVHDLEEHIKKLNEQIQILQELSFFKEYGNAEKTKIIDSLKGKYPVKALCRALEIRKSIYYHHHRKPKTYVERQDDILKPILLDLYHRHRKAVGSKKLRLYIKRQGIDISKKRVQRLMRELNIAKLRTNKPKFHYQHLHKKSCLNLLNRDFNMPAPNQAWVSDIKYVLVGKRFMYICVIIDLFSRLILSYKISNRITTDIAIDAFSEAYTKRNRPKNLIFHSDLGAQYTSTKFKNYLLSLKIKQSFSAPGTPYDNAIAESFFATYSREYINLCGPFNYVRKFKATNRDFINWYNNERIHESLKYITPMEKEEQFDRDFPGFRNKVESGKFQF